MSPSENSADQAANMPNMSLMYSAFTPTFGNIMFQISPSQTGEVSNTFGTIPYLSLEALVYNQQMNAQVSPTDIMPGQNTGQQNINGQYTVTNSLGQQQILIGYQQNGFATNTAAANS